MIKIHDQTNGNIVRTTSLDIIIIHYLRTAKENQILSKSIEIMHLN